MSLVEIMGSLRQKPGIYPKILCQDFVGVNVTLHNHKM